jgi:hypothetical protein
MITSIQARASLQSSRREGFLQMLGARKCLCTDLLREAPVKTAT